MIIVGDSKTYQSVIDRTKRHTHTHKTISEDLNDIVNETKKIGAINRYRILQSTEYAFFSSNMEHYQNLTDAKP